MTVMVLPEGVSVQPKNLSRMPEEFGPEKIIGASSDL